VLAERILAASEPGSNRQLIAARQTVDATSDVALLGRWRAGDVPEGLPFDDNLRWRILCALCSENAADQSDIDELRASDPSSQGALHALGAQASIATSEAKEEAWRAITTDAALSNYQVYALAERFFQPEHGGVTAPYVARYFAEIPGTSMLRSGWVAERAASLVYPRYAVSGETVDLAESCMQRDDLTAGVRRSISDGTDDLIRVLSSRRSFAG
jgi:aminopeptidase N